MTQDRQRFQMKVFSVVSYTQYEGFDFYGVFGSREDAVSWIKSFEGYKNKWRDGYGVIESELGEIVDSYDDVEYVDYE
jgi:hypothetical protein